MKIFNNYSNYYDLLYQDKDYRKEVEFIHQVIQKHLPSAKSILDLGCGTGLHDITLAQKGYQVNGVDFSPNMIKMAQNNVKHLQKQINSKISFTIGDARDFSLNKKFDVVIALFHVASYMSSNQDLISFFLTAKNHLKKGGIFIFDGWYGPAVLTDRPSIRVKNIEDEKIKVTRTATPNMIPNQSLVEVNYKINIFDKKDKKNKLVTEKHVMRYLFQPEVQLILDSIKFKQLSVKEWMTQKTPGFNTWYVYWVTKL